MSSMHRRILSAGLVTVLLAGGVAATVAAPAFAADPPNTLGQLTVPDQFVQGQDSTVTLDLEIPDGVPTDELPYQIRVITSANPDQSVVTATATAPLTDCLTTPNRPPQDPGWLTSCSWPNSAVGQTAQVILTVRPNVGYTGNAITIAAYQSTPNRAQSAPLVTRTVPVAPPTSGSVLVRKATSADTRLRIFTARLQLSCSNNQSASTEIPVGESSAEFGLSTTDNPVTCSAAESDTGAKPGVAVTTTATISYNGGDATPYTLGTPFTVAFGDAVVVAIDNEFTPPPGTYTLSKTTTADRSLRPDDAVLDVSCTDVTGSNTYRVPPGQSDIIWAPRQVTGTAQCVITEPQTGAARGVSVATNGNIIINGGARTPYRLGDSFTVTPGDVIRVSLVNIFTRDPGTLLISKQTTADTTLRPQPAIIAYSCVGGPSDQFVVPAGTDSNTSGAITLRTSTDCTITEPVSGAVNGATVDTTATLNVNGEPRPYRLGDSFPVAPGDLIGVTITNAITAPPAPPTPTPTPTPTPPAPGGGGGGLATTGFEGGGQLPFLVGGAIVALLAGSALIVFTIRRRRTP